MNLYVDSAKIDEIKKSLSLGYVHGITTNPTLLKKAEVWKESNNLRSFYSKILDLCDGEVFVQIPSQKFEPILGELESLDMSRLIIKIPSVSSSVEIAKNLVDRGYGICATAVYTPSQAIVWASLDANYVSV
ncbi:MAG: transaldolase, partial [Thermotogae bacterium]|nr:transaldolase [Thermotogota bacterium]